MCLNHKHLTYNKANIDLWCRAICVLWIFHKPPYCPHNRYNILIWESSVHLLANTIHQMLNDTDDIMTKMGVLPLLTILLTLFWQFNFWLHFDVYVHLRYCYCKQRILSMLLIFILFMFVYNIYTYHLNESCLTLKMTT